MKLHSLLLFILLISIGCKKDLSGHWHAEVGDYEYTIDIENNEDCYLIHSLSNEPSQGKHFGDKNEVTIYGANCGVYDFNYKIKNDIIYIQNNIKKEIILKKRPNCNKINDYKSKLSIELLNINNRINDSIYLHPLNEYINIGFSKIDNNLLIEHWQLDGLKTIKEIDSLSHKIEERNFEQNIPYINYVLTPDQNITGKSLNEIIAILNKNGKKRIYLRTLKDNFSATDRNIFNYINLKRHRLNLDSNKTLNEIIKNYLQQRL